MQSKREQFILRKLWELRRPIFSSLAALMILLCALHLIFGKLPDKISVLCFAAVAFLITFVFMAFAFEYFALRSEKFANFAKTFFLIMGAITMVVDVINFFTAFPNGLSPSIGGMAGLLAGVVFASKPAEK